MTIEYATKRRALWGNHPTDAFFRGVQLMTLCLVKLVRSSATGESAGMWSHTTLIETRIGTDNRAPGMPQSQVQKINETKITTGLRVKRRPSTIGVMKLASNRWSSRYQAGGRRLFQGESSVSR